MATSLEELKEHLQEMHVITLAKWRLVLRVCSECRKSGSWKHTQEIGSSFLGQEGVQADKWMK